MENYVSINSDRLWARLNEVGHIGSDPRGGISRFAWEPPYKEAVMLLIRWIKEAGLTARIDTVGNVFARLEGDDPHAPAVLSGSHFDTVPQGGCFDGLAGVMGALEALVAIKESGLPHKKPLEMVAFINEEASQFFGRNIRKQGDMRDASGRLRFSSAQSTDRSASQRCHERIRDGGWIQKG